MSNSHVLLFLCLCVYVCFCAAICTLVAHLLAHLFQFYLGDLSDQVAGEGSVQHLSERGGAIVFCHSQPRPLSLCGSYAIPSSLCLGQNLFFVLPTCLFQTLRCTQFPTCSLPRSVRYLNLVMENVELTSKASTSLNYYLKCPLLHTFPNSGHLPFSGCPWVLFF